MLNLIRFALLFFAFGILATPLLDKSGTLEEFAFAMAEDAAGQDSYLSLSQIIQPSDNFGDGPFSPQGIARRADKLRVCPSVADAALMPASEDFLSNRPLYLLHHNFLFYDCRA